MKYKLGQIKTFFGNHTSILVMGLGSVSLFLSNILLKDYLTINQYFEYSIIITLLALLNSFGALGVDQAFLRLSEIKDKKTVLIDIKLIPLALTAIIISTTIVLIYYRQNFNISLNSFFVFSLFLGLNTSMLIYNILRITSNFFYAQLIQNMWRIGILVFTGLIIFNNLFFALYISYLTSIIWISIIIICLLVRNSLHVKYSNKNELKLIFGYVFHFFISLLSISFLMQGDRLIIENMFSREEFGNYFYLATLFLFPFSFLQNYIGFKELVKMKKENIDFVKILKNIFVLTLGFTCTLFVTIFLLEFLNYIKLDSDKPFIYIFLFLVIGNIKIYYAIFSSYIGVKASVNQIKKMNFIFISLGIILFIALLNIEKSITIVLLYFVLLWFMRLSIWSYFTKTIFCKITKKHNQKK